MTEKINIAEILKECPKGMELDCTIWDNVVLAHVDINSKYPIWIKKMEGEIEFLTENGCFDFGCSAKCVIYPKGKTTWEGFQRPFKDGDVVVAEDAESFQLFLLKHLTHSEDDNNYDGYCYFGWNFQCNELFEKGNWGFNRLATEKEKEKLFQAIKDNGFHWNTDTKTLEKLVKPKFKVGDRIKKKGDTRLTTIKDIRDNYYIITIPDFFDNAYITDKLLFSNQNEYKIIPNKFDITTLKPFDRVLVRGDVGQKWTHDFFGFMDKDKGLPFVCVGYYVIQCIPYEGNEHLLGTTDDCDEFYKNW